MTKTELMLEFLKLQNQVDVEAIELMGKFVKRALECGEPKEFLKEVLRAVVNTPEKATVQVVSVKLLPPKKG